jgi:hypothetical protein
MRFNFSALGGLTSYSQGGSTLTGKEVQHSTGNKNQQPKYKKVSSCLTACKTVD